MPRTEDKSTLFVDISELVQRDSKTGIQRVVRSIVNVFLMHGAVDYRVEFIYASVGEPYRHAYRYIQQLRGIPEPTTVDVIADPQVGDIFLVLDFQSIVVATKAIFLQQIRDRGAKVYFVVYDLLPIHFKNYFALDLWQIHTLWLNTVAQSDGAICISRSVATELEDWLKVNRPIRLQPFRIGWFHLGADIEASQPSRGFSSDDADTLLSLCTRPTFLLVGTIEPRKGITQVFAGFRELWQRTIDVNLVLVGKQGWLVDELASALHASPELGKRLFWLSGISDEYLEKVYAASTCLIAATEGEGFGLPLVEAAHHKLPIIARDIAVFREVAGTHAFYFAGLEASVLADAVMKWLALYKSGQHPKSDEMPSLTWSQSTAQLLDVVLNNKWSASWMSDGHFQCAGSDPRLQTQVGMKRGLSIQTTGVEGVFLYGPYIALPAGDYQIKLHGKIKRTGVGNLKLEATIDFGDKVLAARALDASRTDGLIVHMAVNIPTAVNTFEVRLWVLADCEICIDKLEIVLQERVATFGSEKNLLAFHRPFEGDNSLHTPEPKNTLNNCLQEILQEDEEEFVNAAFHALL